MPDYVLIRTEGEAAVNGFDALLTTLVESDQWKPGTRQIVDHRKLIANNITSDDILHIKNVVKKYAEKLGNGRCAFVVNDKLGFGLARMYNLSGGDELHQESSIFYSVDEAAAWLKQ